MIFFKRLWICLVLLSVVVACKQPTVTKSPVNAASSDQATPVTVIKGERVVDLDEVPQLSVLLNLKACLGPSRWRDSRSASEARIGAVSVAPTSKGAAESNQPDAKVFQPHTPLDASDSTSKATVRYFWRLNRDVYSLDVIAYSFKESTKGEDTKTESSLKKEINFMTGREITLTVEGVWVDGVCKLSWQ